jgi:diaminohydroxyphosphoribosylaminopyrimidine deaminase/5-amino-6-(5-phosphoribosylamino)uracil reductase
LLTDESYIKLTLEIAKRGAGSVSPNPMVGCVIIKNDKIIGAGYHERYGENHAEVNAIESAKESVEGAVLYVNLEPCCHEGKTPPCVDRIIKEKIKKVVVGTLDMNPVVSGKGIKKLKAAGIEVKAGVLEQECIDLNKFFFKYISRQMPYVTLKAAQTLDGRIADVSGQSRWISSLPSRKKVHMLRAKYDAVMVGTNTILKDDPKLNVRLIEGRNPVRVIIDTKLAVSLDHNIYFDNNIILVTSNAAAAKKKKMYKKIVDKGIDVILIDSLDNGRVDLKTILKQLAERNISSLLVEGGSRLYTSFIDENLFDDIALFISPKLLGAGLSTINDLGIKSMKDVYKLKINSFEKVGDDLFLELNKN